MNTLTAKLEEIEVPKCITCRDVYCNLHTEQLEDYTMAIMEIIESAAEDCLHSSGGGKVISSAKVVPGWSLYVKPYAEDSKFWHAVWQSAAKPNHGPLFEIMTHTKRQYKYAIRRLKRANENIQNDKFIQSLMKGGCKYL